MELSPINVKYIKYLLKEGLTDKIYDRTDYMEGIDRSYEYEEEDTISIFEIDNKKERLRDTDSVDRLDLVGPKR